MYYLIKKSNLLLIFQLFEPKSTSERFEEVILRVTKS